MCNDVPRSSGIDLVELLVAFWNRKWLIVATTLLFAVAGISYALLAKSMYRAEVLLAPAQLNSTPPVPAGLSSLAGLAGVNLGPPRDTAEAIATLRSRAFIEEFIEDKSLLSVLFSERWDEAEKRWTGDPEDWPDVQDGVKFFVENVRSVEEDPETGIVTFAIEWSDPHRAAAWAEELVDRINERLRARDLAESEKRLEYLHSQLDGSGLVELRQAIASLIQSQVETIMLAHAESEYAFKVIDPPRVPNEHVSPRRLLIVALATFAGGLFGCAVALFHWSIVGPFRDARTSTRQ